MPYLFIENFQTADDYANRPFYATFTRWLKYIAFFLAIFLPGLYVGIAAHDPELLPETLLVTIAQAERSTPFPVMLEAILLYFMYELSLPGTRFRNYTSPWLYCVLFLFWWAVYGVCGACLQALRFYYSSFAAKQAFPCRFWPRSHHFGFPPCGMGLYARDGND